jgi:short-subunit dehydrogenase
VAPDNFVYVMKPLFQINLIGSICTFQPLLQRFMDRQRGQIAIMSSISGLYIPALLLLQINHFLIQI